MINEISIEKVGFHVDVVTTDDEKVEMWFFRKDYEHEGPHELTMKVVSDEESHKFDCLELFKWPDDETFEADIRLALHHHDAQSIWPGRHDIQEIKNITYEVIVRLDGDDGGSPAILNISFRKSFDITINDGYTVWRDNVCYPEDILGYIKNKLVDCFEKRNTPFIKELRKLEAKLGRVPTIREVEIRLGRRLEGEERTAIILRGYISKVRTT